MKNLPFVIKSFGTYALVLEWPAVVDSDILEEILRFKEYLQNSHLKGSGWEFVPIYHSLTLIDHNGDHEMAEVAYNLPEWFARCPKKQKKPAYVWDLPVCYDGPHGIDLLETARLLDLDPETLIRQHTAQAYRVYGVGFLPGFLYLGGVPESLQLPRRDHPRLKVPKGSVGLAGAQTGIYPQTSPGGWHIIGNCPVPLFSADKDPPCLVKAGDLIRFRSVSQAEYDLYQLESEIGIYNYKKDKTGA